MSVALDQPVASEATPHTIPTSEELDKMVKNAPFFFAGRRDGTAFYECHKVEDGIAFRLYGSAQDADWEWRRQTDFETMCLSLFRVDIDAYQSAIQSLVDCIFKWRRRYRSAWQSMGGKSRNRLGKRIANALGD